MTALSRVLTFTRFPLFSNASFPNLFLKAKYSSFHVIIIEPPNIQMFSFSSHDEYPIKEL